MSEQRRVVRRCANSGHDIELCFQAFGNPSHPAVMLVGGLNMQSFAWDEAFCEQIVRLGFYVIRFDNRDIGHSTKIETIVSGGNGEGGEMMGAYSSSSGGGGGGVGLSTSLAGTPSSGADSSGGGSERSHLINNTNNSTSGVIGSGSVPSSRLRNAAAATSSADAAPPLHVSQQQPQQQLLGGVGSTAVSVAGGSNSNSSTSRTTATAAGWSHHTVSAGNGWVASTVRSVKRFLRAVPGATSILPSSWTTPSESFYPSSTSSSSGSRLLPSVRVPAIVPWKLFLPRWLACGECLPYELDDMALDALALLDVLGVERAHIVGVSMGGMIAQLMAIHAPRRVQTLTCIMSSTNARDLPHPALWVKLWMLRKPNKGSTREELIEFRMKALQGLLYGCVPVDEAYLKRRIAMSLNRSAYGEGLIRQAAAIMRAEPRDALLQQVTCPSLIIHGQTDVLCRVEHGYRLGKVLPNAKLVVFKNMGHYLNPAYFDAIVEEFVDLVDRERMIAALQQQQQQDEELGERIPLPREGVVASSLAAAYTGRDEDEEGGAAWRQPSSAHTLTEAGAQYDHHNNSASSSSFKAEEIRVRLARSAAGKQMSTMMMEPPRRDESVVGVSSSSGRVEVMQPKQQQQQQQTLIGQSNSDDGGDVRCSSSLLSRQQQPDKGASSSLLWWRR